MGWPFRRRRTGRHRMQGPRAGVVLPGVALHTYDAHEQDAHQLADMPAAPPIAEPVLEPVIEVVADAAAAAAPAVPEPRAADDPEIMPLPARVVLCFEDGTRQVVTPLSDDAERMRATAERLMGVPSGAAAPARRTHQAPA